MQSDFEYLDEMTGATGGLAFVANGISNINNAITSFMDKSFGADEVDAMDASCNTCKHFQRKPMNAKEKADRNFYGMPGRCVIKHIAVIGWHRNQYCGHENANCYENRRTGMKHTEA